MFINELRPKSKKLDAGVVVPHIDTMASFGTVVILLNDVEEQDQLTLYNGKMDALGSAVQTTGMHKAGVGCAFRTGVPHAVVGGCLKGARPVYHQHIFSSKL